MSNTIKVTSPGVRRLGVSGDDGIKCHVTILVQIGEVKRFRFDVIGLSQQYITRTSLPGHIPDNGLTPSSLRGPVLD